MCGFSTVILIYVEPSKMFYPFSKVKPIGLKE